uniref:Uncharacterized protein n=1 Tax=Arundo donax TaxID=35708 RepID=A0A0A9FMZ5_ARUDO
MRSLGGVVLVQLEGDPKSRTSREEDEEKVKEEGESYHRRPCRRG